MWELGVEIRHSSVGSYKLQGVFEILSLHSYFYINRLTKCFYKWSPSCDEAGCTQAEVLEFKRANPLGREFVLVCASVCYITTVSLWVDITLEPLKYLESQQRSSRSSEPFPVCLHSGLFCLWTHLCFRSRNEPSLGVSVLEKESEFRTVQWFSLCPNNWTVLVVSQLKLVKKVLEHFTGISAVGTVLMS